MNHLYVVRKKVYLAHSLHLSSFASSDFWLSLFLLSVVMEVIDSMQVACKLYKGLSDALICTDDFITKVVQR